MTPAHTELPKLTCNRCGHTWTPRDTMTPKRCAKCRSPYWATARKEKAQQATNRS